MIHDSSPWKAALAQDADIIERWAAKSRQSERRSFLIERKIFLSAYSMRKLDDAAKLSTDLLAQRIEVTRFTQKRAGYSEINNNRFDAHFDLSNPQRFELPRRRLLNLLVHSLVFVEVLGEADRYDAFMVTSDHERARGLFQVEMAAFTGLMRLAANDYPSDAVYTRDETTGQWRIWAGYGKPPTG